VRITFSIINKFNKMTRFVGVVMFRIN